MRQVPNILFITLDQFRGDHLGVMGHEVVKTPHLDALAARGVLFTKHYSNCAPCGPSRASIWTGLYLHNHRSVGNGTPLSSDIDNLAKLAATVDMRPVLFGYTDTTVDPRTVDDAGDPRLRDWEGLLDGIDVGVQLNTAAEPWVDWLRERGADFASAEEANEPVPDYPGSEDRGSTFAPPSYRRAELTETAFLAEKIIDWIGRAQADSPSRPWFVHGSFLRPHPPFIVPEPYNTLYDPTEADERRGLGSVEETSEIHQLVAMPLLLEGFTAGPTDETEYRQLRATYCGMVSEVDDQMGRLFAFLEESGLASNTVVIVTSDHGEHLGDHYLISKFGFFDESYHIPLIVAGPGVEKGVVIDSYTENVDLFPTIAELIDVAPRAHVDGRSLVPFLGGETPDSWRDAAFWEFDYRAVLGDPSLVGADRLEDCWISVIRDDAGKYVHTGFNFGEPLLFDYSDDPDETRNVAGDASHLGMVADYLSRLMSWRMRHSESTLANVVIRPDGAIDLRTKQQTTLLATKLP